MNRRDEAPRAVDKPEPGYFSMRLVKNGPQVAARILYDTAVGWSAIINGVVCGPAAEDPVHANGVFRIWLGATRSTESEYRYLLKSAAWANKHAPDDPMANPSKPIDLRNLPPVF